ncbi:DegV family protein [Clostridium tagluense]|uniref:DegV family protein n=1 Tax=Clostridium tagluense TaxID=360422 RepID=UPI001C6F5C23|nr:DegV family protein [Clostridium tagluense]MBW9155866.1 DegV family protein [Clostridium tagluense]WLC63919.1 DegV family protein [Clostridium tagluense]
MSKIALITDSTSDVDREMIEKYDLKVLPLRIIYKDREYIDRVTITPKEVYDNFIYEIPSTSLPSMQDMEDMYVKLEEEGYTHAIAVIISAGLSGTYNTLRLVSENHPSIETCVFDSKSLTIGEAAIVEECGEMIQSGKNFDQIVAALPEMQSRITVYYAVDTLKYLIKGGRIGKVSGTIGEILNIKPIISINSDGVYYTYAKPKGKKKAISKLVDIAREALEITPCKIWVMHGGAYEEVKPFSETIASLPNITRLCFGEISPVAGVHTGPGLLGIIIVKEASTKIYH